MISGAQFRDAERDEKDFEKIHEGKVEWIEAEEVHPELSEQDPHYEVQNDLSYQVKKG